MCVCMYICVCIHIHPKQVELLMQHGYYASSY